MNGPGPYEIVRIKTTDRFNRPLTIIQGVKVVTLGRDFNNTVVLTAGIEKIYFGSEFNQSLENLPHSLLELELGFRFDRPLTLPTHLRRLSLQSTYSFNHPITLPPNIKYVALGLKFDKPLVLPESVESVTLGVHFNQMLVLPQGIKEVCFKEGLSEASTARFNRTLALPHNIKKVIMGGRFNHPLTFPLGIQEVHLGRDFNRPLDLPPTLKSLSLACLRLDHPLLLPENLDTLRISYPFPSPNMVLPTYLQDMQLAFPPKLRTLFWDCNLPVTASGSIKKIEFGRTFAHYVDLPEGLEHVYFMNALYNMPLVLPSTLVFLVFGREYDFPLDMPPHCIREKVGPL